MSDESGVGAMTAPVTIELEHSEALVLWEFLSRVDDIWAASAPNGKVEICITDMAEMCALWRTKANLDHHLTEMFKPNYGEFLAAAQRELRHQAGDWPTES
jgi:hypothetical protein